MERIMSFPYRADQVGSLLRPPELVQVRKAPDTDPARLRELEDHCVLHALERQKELGFKIFSDGEFRRRGFMSGFYTSVEGLDAGVTINRTWQGQSGGKDNLLSGVVVDKIRRTKRMTADETAFLKQHCPGDFKITLPSANQFPAIMYKRGVSSRAYPTYSDFLWDVVPIIRDEVRALVQDGVKYIQIDAPRYSYYIDPKWRQYVQDELAVDPEQALDEAIRADNACLEGVRRPGTVIAIHLCRGNNRSQWYAEGGYDPIAEKLFTQLNVDAFLLEYESERAGTFGPLCFVPRDKTVVLGLISSKLPQLEPQEQLLHRIEEATKYLPLDNLAVSTQCGFASTMEGNLLTEDEQWRKLQLVVDTARVVWGA
jgi:5-methyltetrahydropteroyltriglutamate--homocysteine methyltransferase